MFYTALMLLLIGLFLLFLELFVPSAGTLGIAAAILILAALIITFREDLQTGTMMLLAVLLVVPAMLFLMIKIWPYTPIGRRILTDEKVFTDILPEGDFYQKRNGLVGKQGVANSKMLPSGQILIDGEKFDAISDGFAIEPGDNIIVKSVKQNRIYVQPVASKPPPDTEPNGAPNDQPSPVDRGFDLESDSIDDLLT